MLSPRTPVTWGEVIQGSCVFIEQKQVDGHVEFIEDELQLGFFRHTMFIFTKSNNKKKKLFISSAHMTDYQ